MNRQIYVGCLCSFRLAQLENHHSVVHHMTVVVFCSYTNAGHGGALMVASNFKVSIAHCDFHNNSALPYLQLVPLTYRYVIRGPFCWACKSRKTKLLFFSVVSF